MRPWQRATHSHPWQTEGGTKVSGERGFGVAGALDHAIVRDVARAAEAAGYPTFWANDTPGGDGLAALAAAAAVTSRIRLAVGVIPLDRQPPERIAARVQELGLPVDRLTLGVGAGGAKQSLDLIRDGVRALQDATGASVVIGALGPRMCALAGEGADGVLLNWLTPDFARASADLVRGAARDGNRPTPSIAGYVRAALGEAATVRVREEAARYAAFPRYAAHFARMGVDPLATCATADTADDLRAQLAPFDAALDETVVRAITATETANAYLDLLSAAAPR